jgi:hypothetical protein
MPLPVSSLRTLRIVVSAFLPVLLVDTPNAKTAAVVMGARRHGIELTRDPWMLAEETGEVVVQAWYRKAVFGDVAVVTSNDVFGDSSTTRARLGGEVSELLGQQESGGIVVVRGPLFRYKEVILDGRGVAGVGFGRAHVITSAGRFAHIASDGVETTHLETAYGRSVLRDGRGGREGSCVSTMEPVL